ncbi:hypothetical protein EMQ25_14405 [Arsenicitalea aurantiaca]|uniref:Uncharacterized protein n=1 Tax=Arsenicitalea aurantiaca TaxID=1783274 RepID=A0A433X5H7_9HYPH|nr:hypothetical protein [Arsenicitalea aurantiaca]RUT29312.1 hypothetical protein EMQ25_14405 [Arsenicitalea aurantiaca]
MLRAAALVGLAGLLAVPAPAHAQADYASAFTDAFAAACVPGRLTYEASLAAARDAGWSTVSAQSHPELAAIMALAEEEARDPELEGAEFHYEAFLKAVAGLPHHLVVSRASFVLDDPEDPWVFVGCHLYNLEATAPIDPAPVTALIGNPISRTQTDQGVESHVWGPPCPMPRTGDTYLNFVEEGSVVADVLPFTGLALNFSTSELPAGEEEPEPYC